MGQCCSQEEDYKLECRTGSMMRQASFQELQDSRNNQQQKKQEILRSYGAQLEEINDGAEINHNYQNIEHAQMIVKKRDNKNEGDIKTKFADLIAHIDDTNQQYVMNAMMNIKSENVSMYDKAKIFDEVLYRIQVSHQEKPEPETLFKAYKKRAPSRNSAQSLSQSKQKSEPDMRTLKSLIVENQKYPTFLTTAPEDHHRSWCEQFDDIYDSENVLVEKKLLADHRYQIKLNGTELLMKKINAPNSKDSGSLWLERSVVDLLQKELKKSEPKKVRIDRQDHALDEMMDIDMNYFNYSRGTLLHCWYRMFQQFELIEKFKISPSNLQRFLIEVNRKYKRVPFHNMTHAFNVTHACFYILLQLKREQVMDETKDEEESRNLGHLSMSMSRSMNRSLIRESVFTDLDVLAMIIACIGHDLDHPGLGNSYFQKAKEARAQTVSNQSILENYHLYMLLRLIDQTEVLSCLSYEQMKDIKEKLKQLVLPTDMSLHFNISDKMDAIIKKLVDTQDKMDQRNVLTDQEKLSLMSFIVHACDISNPIQKFDRFNQWGVRVRQEFVDLYDAESDLQFIFGDEKEGGVGGVEAPLAFMGPVNYKGHCQSQVGFAKTFVLPTWQTMAKLMPRLQFLVDRVNDNINKYLKIVQSLEGKEKQQSQ